jgi:XTP/dITP diphosphohydrolase
MAHEFEGRGLAGLVEMTARLRGPGGCPWDADQTHASLVQYLVEETHELIEAIETGDRGEMIEELGDVLYQVLFHSDIAAHTPGEDFDIDMVADHMTAKMVARHPHVFGDREADTAADVVAFWDDLKATEKPHRTSVLDGIPMGMPALALADKMIGRAERVGAPVAVERADDVAVAELDAADLDAGPTEEELGDQLLAIVADARERGLDSERALRGALRRLGDRIRETEGSATAQA